MCSDYLLLNCKLPKTFVAKTTILSSCDFVGQKFRWGSARRLLHSFNWGHLVALITKLYCNQMPPSGQRSTFVSVLLMFLWWPPAHPVNGTKSTVLSCTWLPKSFQDFWQWGHLVQKNHMNVVSCLGPPVLTQTLRALSTIHLLGMWIPPICPCLAFAQFHFKPMDPRGIVRGSCLVFERPLNWNGSTS